MPFTIKDGPTGEALLAVAVERDRQEDLCVRKRNEGLAFFSCADPRMDDEQRLPVLGEEFGEVARELCESRAAHYDQPNLVKLRTELVQLAAVAVAWVESVDARMVEAASRAA